MKKKLMRLLSAAVLLFFTLSLAACGLRDPDAAGIKYLIGISLANMREPWRLVMVEELEEAAAKYPELRLIFTDAAASSEKQEEDIDRLLSYGIDLLIVSPNDAAQLTPIVCRVYQTIPVIVLDRMVEGYDYSLFIGPGNEAIGYAAGEKVIEMAGAEAARVLEIRGRSDSQSTVDRSAGFASAVSALPGLSCAAIEVRDESRDMAEDTVMALGEDLSDVDIIFAYNDYMALGACRALGRLGYEGIRIVSVDGFPGSNGGLELLRQGQIEATITCPTGGREAIQNALDILNQVGGVPKQIILRSHVVTAENVDLYETDKERESSPPEGTIRVGYAQVGTESGWRLTNNASIEEAARLAGIELYAIDADQSQQVQINSLREFIAQDMDVIVLSPVVSSGWDAVLSEARDAGIPVILSDRQIDVADHSLYTTFIGPDAVEEGRRAMRWVEQNVPPRSDGGPVRIMEIQGTPGSSPAIDRKQGFEQILDGLPQYALACSMECDFTQQGGYDLVKRYLQAHDWNYEVLFSHNDDMALGAADALQVAGIRPGEDVKIISVDGTHAALKALVEGRLNCVVECSPILGPQLMKAILDLMSGKELPLRIITDEIVFTAENAKEALPDRLY
jgi:simple sugar transport system substrate-binding protein